MPRPEKVQAVAEIKERLEEARAVFLTEFSGLSVKEQQELRRGLRSNEAEFKVVKMTLARRAADELGLDALDEWLSGPTALAFAMGDPVGAAKVLKDFAKDHPVLKVKGGLLGGELLTPERIEELAEIEPREVLLAKIAGALSAPLTQMAGLLAALPRNAATAMQQLLEKKEQEPGAATEAAAADETAPEAEAAEEPAEAEEAAPEEAAPEATEEAPAEEAAPEAEAEAEAAPEAAPEAAEEPAEAEEAAPEATQTDTETDTGSDDPDETAADTAEEE